jgi:hypothetical protein
MKQPDIRSHQETAIVQSKGDMKTPKKRHPAKKAGKSIKKRQCPLKAQRKCSFY